MRKIKGFSIIEVMISFLVLSIMLVAMTPLVTKKIRSKSFSEDGVVYTYRSDNHTTNNEACYVTRVTNYNATPNTVTYGATKECSEYTFTVPRGIAQVNLTLVAGGGGGGGAAGGKVETKTISYRDGMSGPIIENENSNFFVDILKSVKINLLISKGKEAKAGGNTNCPEGAARCGGMGGESSPAIVEFKLPYSIMKGQKFTPKIGLTQKSDAQKGRLKIGYDSSSDAYYVSVSNENNPENKYQIKESGEDYELSCLLKDGVSSYLTSGANLQDFLSSCKIQESNYIPSYKGKDGQSVKSDDTVTSGMQLSGGTGGKNPYARVGAISYGSGGTGKAYKLSCPGGPASNTCMAGSSESSTVSDTGATQEGGAVSATYEIERPGGTGAGGAGGTMVRILGFPVKAGERYIIRVGKGGMGGNGGISSITPTDAENGSGGVSTAIYKVIENGNNTTEQLVYMVNGGAGGEGGKIYSASSSWSGAFGQIPKVIPALYAANFSNTKLDKKFVTAGSALQQTAINGASPYALNYALLHTDTSANKNPEPYYTMSGKQSTSSNYLQSFQPTKNTSGTNPTVTINGKKITNALDGLYYRNIVNDKAYYVGGLGGFSGLFVKGGCGGFFQGNSSGIRSLMTGDESNSDLKYKFITGSSAYPVFGYYDNCNIASPDGQSANFIAPNPTSLSFGSAGSGGGGGGYSIETGAGNGGSGQNGYLMIDWKE